MASRAHVVVALVSAFVSGGAWGAIAALAAVGMLTSANVYIELTIAGLLFLGSVMFAKSPPIQALRGGDDGE